MKGIRKITLFAVFGFMMGVFVHGATGAPRALVVDYQMNPPVVLAGLLESLKAAGFEVTYRPYYPRLTWRDFGAYSLVIVLSGDGPGYPGAGMSASALGPLEGFVRKGGALILAPLSGDAKRKGGDHERYVFNLLLHRLGVSIRIRDDWITDDRNGYAASLYQAPFATPIPDHRVTRGLGPRMVTDRSSSLQVGEGSTVLVRTFPTAFPRGEPSKRGSYPLVAMGQAGRGIVAVASRYILTWGAGNAKEPGEPLLPLPEEETTLRVFLRNLLVYLHNAVTTGAISAIRPPQSVLPPPESPDFPLVDEPLPETPPPGILEVHKWQQPEAPPHLPSDPSYDWILAHGIRSGWAYIDREMDELERLARGLTQSRMNLLWGVGFPQLFVSPKGTLEARTKLKARWEKLADELSNSSVRWFVGMEYPGRYASTQHMAKAVGAEGRTWEIPSPWDRELWRREVVAPAKSMARWARNKSAVGGIVVDLEMYGRSPLFFSQGVDFGDEPFRAFLDAKGLGSKERPWALSPDARFPWLRDRRLLGDYYAFLEKRAEEMGNELRQAVRAMHPDLILGCYSAGILHRWFYRGLWRGMSEPERPMLLFTFQRDVEMDLAALRASGIHVLHVRGLLMGMMDREDYLPLFRDALSRHWGYWLNRLTSLVASNGFYPVEAPKGLTQEKAWQAIGEANRGALFNKGP